jgi:hypothetical protein
MVLARLPVVQAAGVAGLKPPGSTSCSAQAGSTLISPQMNGADCRMRTNYRKDMVLHREQLIRLISTAGGQNAKGYSPPVGDFGINNTGRSRPGPACK